LEHEYAKPYSGQPFGINKNTTLELVEESEYKRLKELLNQMNINDNRSQQVL
jgi:penicillin-binding protein 2